MTTVISPTPAAADGQRLRGHVAVVTGAANGIGRAFAPRLAAEGASVAVLDLVDGSETVEDILRADGTAASFSVDISDSRQVTGREVEIFAFEVHSSSATGRRWRPSRRSSERSRLGNAKRSARCRRRHALPGPCRARESDHAGEPAEVFALLARPSRSRQPGWSGVT